nr:hypothetical protein [Tanacetum cinerariifolium]
MRMEQYLTFTDHALWEVIVNGDSVTAVALASAEGPIPPTTAKQKLARKNKLKAKSALMLAIPDEHLLKFHACKDADSLWEAIKNRFGGNKESKKMQKTILKQNYKNFDASSQKGPDKPMIDFRSSLVNLKFMVYESEIKTQSSSSSNSHNVAFVFSDNTSSTTETINIAHSVSAASFKDQASTGSYADDVMFSFFSHQSNALQLDNEDLEQIDTNDLKEMDLKWQVAMLTMRVKRRGHFTRECTAPRNLENRNRDTPTRNAPVDTSTTNALREVLNKSNLEIIGCQMGLESLEARIVVHEKSEAVYEEDIVFLEYDIQVKDISIKDLKNQLENALKEEDDLKLKLEKFETFSKNLTKLINSQISAIDKTGLGYDGQMNKSDLNDIHVNKSEVLNNVGDSHESDGDDNQVNDRFKKGEGYHAVPPPYTGNYMPPRADLSFVGLDNFVFKSKNTTVENEIKAEKPKKFSQSPRGNKRNWNGLMTQKLRDGFEFKNKACFVCGSINHLIKDCDFYENKMVLNNKGKITGPKEIRAVWDNTARVNHQNKLIHQHPKRNFIPVAVLTDSGQVPVNAAKQSSHRAAISVSAVRRVNTAASRPNVNDALPTTYSYFKAHSPVRRPFIQKSAAKTNNFNEKINIAKDNNVTTTGPKAVVSAAECPKSSEDEVADDARKKSTKVPRKENGVQDPAKEGQDKDANGNRIFTPVSAAGSTYVNLGGSFPVNAATLPNIDLPTDLLMPDLEDTEVYVCQPPGFEDPHFLNKFYKVEKALYGPHQAPRAWYETLSTYLLENRFRRGIIDKTLFIKKGKVKTASTPIETNKALLKDEEAVDVVVHLYRSMIGSLMYLTSSRPDIMFAVCSCARFHVTPKVSHLHAVNRIFRYLKDSDYAGASLDRKSTIGGCQFLRKRLISWQCKKQTVVANSTTKAEYVAATNSYG